MKTSISVSMFLVLVNLTAMSVPALAGQEGKGGDPLEPLFIKAQKDAIRIIQAVKPEAIDKLAINEAFKTWLKKEDRLSKVQFYASAMQLVFQEAPCLENAVPRGTCYDDTDSSAPKMIVSRTFNRMTTPDQATALVFHEAGHFTGESDHLLLSRFGVEMTAQALAVPTTFEKEGGVVTAWVNLDLNDKQWKVDNKPTSIARYRDRAKEAALASATKACLLAGHKTCKVTWIQDFGCGAQKKLGQAESEEYDPSSPAYQQSEYHRFARLVCRASAIAAAN